MKLERENWENTFLFTLPFTGIKVIKKDDNTITVKKKLGGKTSKKYPFQTLTWLHDDDFRIVDKYWKYEQIGDELVILVTLVYKPMQLSTLLIEPPTPMEIETESISATSNDAHYDCDAIRELLKTTLVFRRTRIDGLM